MQRFGVFIAAIFVIGGGSAQSQGIQYTEQAIGSGSLGTTSFTNATVIITFNGDIANVINPSSGVFINRVGSSTLTVSGIGTTTFTNQLQVFSAQNGSSAGGISDQPSGADILDTSSGAFSTYDLKTAFGPTTGRSLFNSDTSYGTSLGNFILNSASDSTFTAAGSGGASTPEPGNIGMLAGMGIAGSVFLKRRRK